MRRHLVAAVAALALIAGACGGGDGDKKNANTSSNGNNNGVSVAAASLASVCGGREAVNIGAAGASAQQSGSVNYDSIASNLRKAAKAAPSEIRDDFAVLVDAQIPFFEALARADGDYMKLSSDSEFAEASQKMSSEDVKTASQNISEWFTSHCS
jgi:hypothetical protein